MTRSRHIPISVQRQVRARANNCCEAEGCECVENLELHHVVEFADGGEHTEANLLLLCADCHKPATALYAKNRRIRNKMAVRKSGYRTSTDKPEKKRKKIPARVNPWPKGRMIR